MSPIRQLRQGRRASSWLGLFTLGSIVGAGLVVSGGSENAWAGHLRGGLITAEYHAPVGDHVAEVHLESVMLATPSSPDDFGTVNVYRDVDGTPTIQSCTVTEDSSVEDTTSNPQFSITTTNLTVRGCFDTPGFYTFQATDSARIDGILNASGTVQYEVGLYVDGVNDSSAPTYNAGYMYNIAYSDTLDYSTNMNGLGQGNSAVTYSLITNTGGGLGGYGASEIPCSDLNTATGQFRINSSLCEGTDTISSKFGGGTKLYALKVKATDANGQYATRDVLLQFQTTSNKAPEFTTTTPSPGALAVTPGTTQTITVSATDPDGDAVGFTQNLSRSWITFSSVTSAVVDGVTTYSRTYTLAPPSDTNEVFQFEISAFDDATFSLSTAVQYDVEAGGVLPPGTPGTPTLTPGGGSLVAVFTAPTSGGTVASYRADVTPVSGGDTTQNSCDPVPALRCSVTGLIGTTEYSVVIVAINESGTATSTASTTTTLAIPAPPRQRAQEELAPQSAQPTPPQRSIVTNDEPVVPRVSEGPILRNGQLPSAPNRPVGYVGDEPRVVDSVVETDSRLTLGLGSVSIAIDVPEDRGGVSDDGGSPEVSVQLGATTAISGQGLRPGVSVQVFLPLDGESARELVRIPVAGDGTFSGETLFAQSQGEAPLPIGRTVLQLVSIDPEGNQVVVEMAVNIAQGVPAPEQNREAGAIPELTPGQSLATSAGVPVDVRVTTVPDQRLLVIEGSDWSMSLNIDSDNSSMEETPNGPMVRLVRADTAAVSGEGFQPGTRVDIWLFSTPTLVGSATVNEEGGFDSVVSIDPSVIDVGQHTLQLQGVGLDGYVKAANMGVVVADSPQTIVNSAEETSLGLFWWSMIALGIVALALVYFWWRARRPISSQ